MKTTYLIYFIIVFFHDFYPEICLWEQNHFVKISSLSWTCILNHSYRIASLYSLMFSLQGIWKLSSVTLDVKGCKRNLCPSLFAPVVNKWYDSGSLVCCCCRQARPANQVTKLQSLAEIWDNNYTNIGWCQNQSTTASILELLSKIQLLSAFICYLMKKIKWKLPHWGHKLLLHIPVWALLLWYMVTSLH